MAGTAMQAIEFVQMQRDDELWELLISLALESPALTGILPFTAVLTHANMYICGQLLFAGPNRPASCLEAGLHLLLVILKLYCLDSSCMGHTCIQSSCCLGVSWTLFVAPAHQLPLPPAVLHET